MWGAVRAVDDSGKEPLSSTGVTILRRDTCGRALRAWNGLVAAAVAVRHDERGQNVLQNSGAYLFFDKDRIGGRRL